jgi:uncharacterized SAM-binding protein YcdF (DUF218 family)
LLLYSQKNRYRGFTRGLLGGTFDIMIYYISKVFWLIVAPTSALILINVVATFCAVLDGSTFAAWLAAAAACGLVIAAFTPIGFSIMVPLENRFALLSLSDLQAAPDGIIFLAAPWPKLAALNQRFPKARIIFSGYTVSETDSENLLGRLGIEWESVVQPRTTSEDALYCAALLKPKPSEKWLLVTYSYHMPRGVGCFRAAGFQVEPYPVNFSTRSSVSFYPLAPSFALDALDRAAKEWIGLVAYRLMGKTDALFPGP